MIDLTRAKRADETDEQRQRRERAARVCQPIFGPETMAQPRDRAVRSEGQSLSAGVGSLTTAATIARRAEPTPADDYKARVAALPKKVQTLAAVGVPITTCELLALVLAHYASKGSPAKLDPGTVASMLGLKREEGARTLTDAITRGLLLPEMGVFGTNGGYRPDS